VVKHTIKFLKRLQSVSKQYTVTVRMDNENVEFKPKYKYSKLNELALIVDSGWATFIGYANSPEEFEQDLIDSVDGMPSHIKAVEGW